MHSFRIYIASSSGGSAAIAGGLDRALVNALDGGPFNIEVINVLESPERAVADSIMVTPTIILKTPAPEIRVAGNCNDMAKVLEQLGLAGTTPPGKDCWK